MATKNTSFPKELKNLVSWSVDLLGQAIQREYGLETFKRVEKMRKSMKSLRRSNPENLFQKLLSEQKLLAKLTTKELSELAHSYSFLLELINRCENAYRSHRLGKKKYILSQKRPYAIIMVLTAHPTEARAPQLLEIFSAIQENLMISLIEEEKSIAGKGRGRQSQKMEVKGVGQCEKELFHLFLIGLKLSLARKKKPTVLDEAENIYSYILRKDILEGLIFFASDNVNLSFRAWVGGDKDGHPGVDEKTMLQSLNLSRSLLINFIVEKLERVKKMMALIHHSEYEQILTIIINCQLTLKRLRKMRADDGKLVVIFKKSFQQLCQKYSQTLKTPSPRLLEIERLLWIFPAIVVPLEVREDSEMVARALKSDRPLAIEKMLLTLKEVSKGLNAKWYVRGLILSMVESHQDILNGLSLVKKVFHRYELPVVPLFENEKALTQGKEILQNYFSSKKSVVSQHINAWGGRFEVMVGYSDSSKENGVFPSRLMISNALRVIEKTLKKEKLIPVFFHGSGGSIERGGGSIKEQTKWWPKSAINIFKATTQGEMVARTFGNHEIFKGQIIKIIEQLSLVQEEGVSRKSHATLDIFSTLVKKHYTSTISNDDFFEVIDSATPYRFLNHLKIGSRPTSRTTGGDSRKLRAIPWILCWTQTRVLFPTWWGTGHAWSELDGPLKKQFKREYKENPLVSSFMNALGFTLAKVELGVWRMYLKSSRLEERKQELIYQNFLKEYKKSISFFREVTGERELLWFRPWLQQSIDYRSSMIHPLNLIQLEALKREEIDLLRDTVTGISCGMLTTG